MHRCVLASVLGGLLLGVPHPGAAQTTGPGPQPRYYAGLAVYTSPFQPLGNRYRSGFRMPLQATFGYQLRPRWAVQAGLAYQGWAYSYSYTDFDYIGNGRSGAPYLIDAAERQQTLAASALARYTLTRQAAHRMQFDLLGGLTLEHYRANWRITRTDSAAAPVATTSYYHDSRLLVTAGLGLRYRLGQHLEATYNLLFNHGLAGYESSFHNRLTGSMALGLQYRFGRR